MLTKEDREIINRSLLEGSDTAPGRIRTSRMYPERKLPPQSCALTKYDNNPHRLVTLCSRDLRAGCGEKVILDAYRDRQPCKFKWGFFLDTSHPDFSKLTSEMRDRMKFTGEGEWLQVADSMEESDPEQGLLSIEESWGRFIELAEAGETIWVDLSRLRPHGTVNEQGLMASGPIGLGNQEPFKKSNSFFHIYQAIANHLLVGNVETLLIILGTINDTLRQGGHKRGIITSSMIWNNPHFKEYLAVPTAIIPGSHRKGVRLTHQMFLDQELVDLVAKAANDEGVFLAKVSPKQPKLAVVKSRTYLEFKTGGEYDLVDHVPGDPEIFPDGIELTEPYDNVCVGLRIRHRGTCLIWRVNYGQCHTFEDIEIAYENAARNLVTEHIEWRGRVGKKKADLFLPVEEDRQVGLCLMGVANALAYWGIKYQDFNAAIARLLKGTSQQTDADRLVYHIARAHQRAVWVADAIMESHQLPLLELIFTVEPGQNHPYHCKDLQGFTCARGIWAPYYNRERRSSEHQENIVVKFGNNIQTARDLGPDFHEDFTENYQLLMELCSGGRAHTISFDTQKPITPDWLANRFMPSGLQAKYYSEHQTYDQSHLKKRTIAVCGLREDECSVCAD